MLILYKAALAPVLLLQARHLRKTALRLPEAAGQRSGLIAAVAPSATLRLLFVGDSSAAGVGVEWQHEAWAEPTARMVFAASSRSVGWELLARSGASTRDMIEMLKSQTLRSADIVICALGVNDVTTQSTARRFISNYQELWSVLAQRTGARAAIVSGLPPLRLLPAAPQPLRWYLGLCAQRLDAALQDFCATQSNVRYVSLAWAQPSEMARDKFHPGKSQYRQWAELVAQQILAMTQGAAN